MQVQPKLCRKITIQIPLLIGLKRLPEFDEKEKSTRFFNKMEVSGKFTLIEVLDGLLISKYKEFKDLLKTYL